MLPFEIPSVAVGIAAVRSAITQLVTDLRAMAAQSADADRAARLTASADYWQGVLDATDFAATAAIAGEELLNAVKTFKATVNPDVSSSY